MTIITSKEGTAGRDEHDFDSSSRYCAQDLNIDPNRDSIFQKKKSNKNEIFLVNIGGSQGSYFNVWCENAGKNLQQISKTDDLNNPGYGFEGTVLDLENPQDGLLTLENWTNYCEKAKSLGLHSFLSIMAQDCDTYKEFGKVPGCDGVIIMCYNGDKPQAYINYVDCFDNKDNKNFTLAFDALKYVPEKYNYTQFTNKSTNCWVWAAYNSISNSKWKNAVDWINAWKQLSHTDSNP